MIHNRIETIFSHKISELNESERIRQGLSQELNHLKDHLMKKHPTEAT